jgi:hypothetical protein
MKPDTAILVDGPKSGHTARRIRRTDFAAREREARKQTTLHSQLFSSITNTSILPIHAGRESLIHSPSISNLAFFPHAGRESSTYALSTNNTRLLSVHAGREAWLPPHLEHGAGQGRCLGHAQHSFQHQTLAPDDLVAGGILVQPLACHRQSAQDRGRGRKLAQEQQSSQRQHRDQEGQSEDQGNSQRLRPAYDYLLDSARRCA